jgi:hypothetical protein
VEHDFPSLVPGPPRQPMARGEPVNERPEADALHHTGHPEVQGARRSPGG